jgi:hypothetical protein
VPVSPRRCSIAATRGCSSCGVEEHVTQLGAGGDHQQLVVVTRFGVLLQDRFLQGVGEADVGGSGCHRRGDP